MMSRVSLYILITIFGLSSFGLSGCDDEPQLPPAKQDVNSKSEEPGRNTNRLNLTPDARIILNGNEISAEEFRDKLDAMPSGATIIVDEDPAADDKAAAENVRILRILIEDYVIEGKLKLETAKKP